MRKGRTARAAAALVAAAWLSGLAAEAPAQQPTPTAPPQKQEPRVLVVAQDALWLEADAAGQLAVSRAPALARGVSQYLAQHPELVRYVSGASLEREVRADPLYEGRLDLARKWGELGIRQFRELDIEGAVANLEKAREEYAKIHHELVAPAEVAELLMYLSLSHVEQEHALDRPLLYMMDMIRFEPGRVLRSGFYPEATVRFYRSALNALLQSLRGQGADPARARALTRLVEADRAVFVYGIPTSADTQQVVLQVWDEGEGRFTERLSLELPRGASEATLEAAANRLASRWIDCLREPPTQAPPPVIDTRGTSPFALSLGGIYTSYLGFPDVRELFGNVGFSAGTQFLLTRDFSLFALFNFFVSLRDRNGELLDEVTSFRGTLGGAFEIELGRLGLGLGVGAEVASLTAFETSPEETGAGCRNDVREACEPQDRTSYDEFSLLVGVQARPMVRLELEPSFSIYGAGSISYYLYPLGLDEMVNFPLTAEFGMRYRF